MKPFLLLLVLSLECTLLLAQLTPPGATLASTYLGGNGANYAIDTAYAVATGSDGSVYVLGQTSSEPFPHTAVIGGSDTGNGTFVTKLTPDGKAVVYSTFISGIGGRALAVDAAGSVHLTGESGGALPGTSSAQTTFGGNFDAFIVKLTPDGKSVVYATYLGGSDLELGRAIALDADGAAYVVGWTSSTNFPATTGAAQTQIAGNYDAFVAKLDPAGTQFGFATYLGGESFDSGAALALDAQRRPVVVGRSASTNFASAPNPTRLGSDKRSFDAYVARLSADGSAVDYLTFVAGESIDAAARVAIATDGSPVILGQTESAELPTTPGVLQPAYRGSRDLFVARLTPAGNALVFCTYLGTDGFDTVNDAQYAGGYYVDGQLEEGTNLQTESGGLALDQDGNVLVTGTTGADTWPDVAAIGHGSFEGIVAKLGAAGDRLLLFNFLGGRAEDAAYGLAGDGAGGVWIVGEAARPFVLPFFTTTSGAAQELFGGGISDAFATHVGLQPLTPVNDGFGARLPLSGSRVTTVGSTAGASKEPGEPAHGGNGGGASIWWTWTAPADGRLRVATQGSFPNALLAAYEGNSLAALTPVVLEPGDPVDPPAARLRFHVVKGTAYAIAVDGPTGVTGDVQLSLAFSEPPNDDFADHLALTGFPATTNGSSVNATSEGSNDFGQAGVPGGQSVWWEWTSPTNGVVAISTAGSSFNTTLGVFTGTSLADLEEVKSNDNYSNQPGADTTSQLTFPATLGTTYFIAVDGYFSASGAIQLSVHPGDPPPNDNFTNRTTLSGFFTRVTTSTVNATLEESAGEKLLTVTNSFGNVDLSSAGYSVWWTWTAPTNGQAKIFTSDITFDTRVGIFTGGALDTLLSVAANDNRGGTPFDFASFVRFPVTAGTTYQIEVDGNIYGGHSGTFTLNLLLERPPAILADTFTKPVDGGVQFQVQGLPGVTYRVEHSATLEAWQSGQTLTPEAEYFTVTDTPEAGQAHLFYRLTEVEAVEPP